MSHFYGTLQGSRGEATRAGSKDSGLTAVAASWEGAVRVTLHHSGDGKDVATVELIPWQGAGINKVLYHGPVSGKK